MSREDTLARVPVLLGAHKAMMRRCPAHYAVADLATQAIRSSIIARRAPWRGEPRALPSSFRKTSDTLFILATGPSINHYTEADWAEVGEADSVGINFWLMHRFVPTAYVTEWIGLERDDSIAIGRRDVRAEIVRRRADDLLGALFLFRLLATRRVRRSSVGPEDVLRQLPVPPAQLLVTSDLNLLPLDADAFVKAAGLARRIGLLRDGSRWRYLFTTRGTVLWALLFAVRMGYRTAVLCGVDLRGTDNFYDDPLAPGLVPGLPVPPAHTRAGPIHRTNDPDRAGPTMHDILAGLSREVFPHVGLTISLGHPMSSLNGLYPIHRWAHTTSMA
jgi:hypothetical protein